MKKGNKAVIYAVEGTVALVTLNRPEKRNALNDELIAGLKESLSKADQDANVRVIVITGAGADFCSGADLAALQKISEASVVENFEDAESLMELFALIRRVKVPVVAAVRGRALAGGCGMVMAILRRNVSEKRAFELIARGAEIDAEEAERIGLVNQVFEDEKFEAEVEAYLEGFERTSRSAIMLSKRLLYHMDGMTFDAALQSGVDVNTIARMTEDCQKGISRFLKK
jgi:methylglutaconyl-CoA hydratase